MKIPDSSSKLATTGPHSRTLTFWPVVRVASGNFLEMFDFQVFGYYAAAIARTFFPSGSEFASLMLSLMTFGAGFLMRPLGAIVTLARSWRLLVLGTLLTIMNTVCFYMITAYTPTFGGTVLHLAARDNMIVTLCVGASRFSLASDHGCGFR